MDKLKQNIGFIGAGQMARALAGGLVDGGLCDGKQIFATDPDESARGAFVESVAGASIAGDVAAVAKKCRVIFLAVKPHFIPAVLADLQSVVSGDHLLISIAAGVKLEALRSGLGPRGRLCRVMPNTPCLVRQGASGYCLDSESSQRTSRTADARLVAAMLSSVGVAFELEERLLDAVTGLSGSGPAFVYIMIEALSDGGVAMGLPRDVATSLAAQTVRGAATMVLDSGEHPGQLKDRVTSPGGTTIAGIGALEAAGIRTALISAVEAATRRAIELGNS